MKSQDGNLLAAGGRGRIVYLWNIEDPQEPKLIRSLKGHQGEIFCVAFSPDGKLLASASRDCTIRLWKLYQIEVYVQNPLKKVLKGHKGCVRAIAFNSEKLNSASDGEAQKKHSTKLASASEDQTIMVWNLENLEEEPEVLHGHSYTVSSVVFDPNNTQRLVSCGWDRTIRFWTLGTEPKIFKVPEQDIVWDKTIRFLNLGAEVKIFQPRQKEVIGITWIDETQFALVRSDGVLEVRECDNQTNSNKSLASCSVSQEISTVVFFGEGKQKKIAVGNSDGSIWIYDLNFQNLKNLLNEPKPLLENHQERRINSLAFSSDGKFLVVGLEYDNQKTIKVWDLEQFIPLDNILLDKLPNESVHSVIFKPHVSNDELILAIAYKSEKIYLCNLKTGNLLTDSPLEHKKIYGDTSIILAFSPDGKTLVSGSDKQYLLLWDISQLDYGNYEPKAIPPYEREPKHSKSEPRLNFWVTALAFKDNRWLASGRYDGSIELWDLQNLENDPLILQGHQEKITAFAFSPDKKQLASASFDNTVRLWTVETKELADKLKKKLYRGLTRQEKDKFLG